MWSELLYKGGALVDAAYNACPQLLFGKGHALRNLLTIGGGVFCLLVVCLFWGGGRVIPRVVERFRGVPFGATQPFAAHPQNAGMAFMDPPTPHRRPHGEGSFERIKGAGTRRTPVAVNERNNGKHAL